MNRFRKQIPQTTSAICERLSRIVLRIPLRESGSPFGRRYRRIVLPDTEFVRQELLAAVEREIKPKKRKPGPKPKPIVKRRIELLQRYSVSKAADILTDEYVKERREFYEKGGDAPGLAERMAIMDGEIFKLEEAGRLRANASDYDLTTIKDKRRKSTKKTSAKKTQK